MLTSLIFGKDKSYEEVKDYQNLIKVSKKLKRMLNRSQQKQNNIKQVLDDFCQEDEQQIIYKQFFKIDDFVSIQMKQDRLENQVEILNIHSIEVSKKFYEISQVYMQYFFKVNNFIENNCEIISQNRERLQQSSKFYQSYSKTNSRNIIVKRNLKNVENLLQEMQNFFQNIPLQFFQEQHNDDNIEFDVNKLQENLKVCILNQSKLKSQNSDVYQVISNFQNKIFDKLFQKANSYLISQIQNLKLNYKDLQTYFKLFLSLKILMQEKYDKKDFIKIFEDNQTLVLNKSFDQEGSFNYKFFQKWFQKLYELEKQQDKNFLEINLQQFLQRTLDVFELNVKSQDNPKEYIKLLNTFEELQLLKQDNLKTFIKQFYEQYLSDLQQKYIFDLILSFDIQKFQQYDISFNLKDFLNIKSLLNEPQQQEIKKIFEDKEQTFFYNQFTKNFLNNNLKLIWFYSEVQRKIDINFDYQMSLIIFIFFFKINNTIKDNINNVQDKHLKDPIYFKHKLEEFKEINNKDLLIYQKKFMQQKEQFKRGLMNNKEKNQIIQEVESIQSQIQQMFQIQDKNRLIVFKRKIQFIIFLQKNFDIFKYVMSILQDNNKISFDEFEKLKDIFVKQLVPSIIDESDIDSLLTHMSKILEKEEEIFVLQKIFKTIMKKYNQTKQKLELISSHLICNKESDYFNIQFIQQILKNLNILFFNDKIIFQIDDINNMVQNQFDQLKSICEQYQQQSEIQLYQETIQQFSQQEKIDDQFLQNLKQNNQFNVYQLIIWKLKQQNIWQKQENLQEFLTNEENLMKYFEINIDNQLKQQ